MIRSYEEFLEALAFFESRGKVDEENPQGFLGLYQMGEEALIDVGYYTWEGDATGKEVNDWTGRWTGLDGINDKEDFKENEAVQKKAIFEFHKLNWLRIELKNLDRFVGQTFIVNGKRIPITEFGILAGAHLKGIGRVGAVINKQQGVRQFLESGGRVDPRDGNGTPISKYMEFMAGFAYPFISDVRPPRPIPRPSNLLIP